MTEISIEPLTRAHLDGLIALVAAEGWTEYSDDVEDPARADRAGRDDAGCDRRRASREHASARDDLGARNGTIAIMR
jgi:hypothetical protein